MDEDRNDLPVLANDSIVQIAAEAEKRVDAIMKIKQIALKVTNARDWTNQQDRPYLQVSGSEKVANLFNISWRIDEPRLEYEEDGHFTFTFKGVFSMGGRSIEVEGSRSSKDPFFKKYEWVDKEGGGREKKERPISAIDKRDVKMAALTNLFGNGISRILGIRNLTWEDLWEFAKIKKEDCQGVEYKKNGEKAPIKEPQKKTAGEATEQPAGPKAITAILNVTKREGVNKETKKPWTKYSIFGLLDGNETSFNTFSQSFADMAAKERGTGALFEISYEKTQYGCDIKDLKPVECGPEPGADAQ